MAALNPPEALPALLVAILAHVRPQAVPLPVLHKRFAPASLEGSKADPTLGGFGVTVRVGRSIGVVSGGTQDDPHVRIGDAFLPTLGNGNFVQALRRWLLTPDEGSADPFAIGDDGSDSTGARDLQRALTWFLQEDALGPPMYWTSKDAAHSVHERQQLLPGELRTFENATRWQAFTRWATFLGFARARSRGRATAYLPDPYVAVREELKDLLKPEEPLVDVLGRLADRVPVVSGGTFHRSMSQQMRARGPRVAHSLAQALLRLSEEDCIALDTVRDYSISNPEGVVHLLEGEEEQRTVTHIRRKGLL